MRQHKLSKRQQPTSRVRGMRTQAAPRGGRGGGQPTSGGWPGIWEADESSAPYRRAGLPLGRESPAPPRPHHRCDALDPAVV